MARQNPEESDATSLKRTSAVVTALIAAGVTIASLFATELIDWRRHDQATEFASNNENAAAQRHEEIIRLQVLESWIPEYLSAEDPLHAERMIVALDADLAESAFVEIRKGLTAADLLDDQLAARLESSITGARLARIAVSTPPVEVSRCAAENDAREIAEELAIGYGYAGVEVRNQDGSFVVIITGAGDDGAAAAILQSLPTELTTCNEPEVDTAPPTTRPAPGTDVAQVVPIPDIFNLVESEAMQMLRDAGFTDITIWRVESGSVLAGRSRQLVVNDGAPLGSEIVLVDQNGPTLEGIPANTSLALKVSVGSG